MLLFSQYGRYILIRKCKRLAFFSPAVQPLLVAKLLYKSKCPSVCMYVCMSVCLSGIGGNEHLFCKYFVGLSGSNATKGFATYGCFHPCICIYKMLIVIFCLLTDIQYFSVVSLILLLDQKGNFQKIIRFLSYVRLIK